MPIFPTDSLYELSHLGLPRLKKRERIVTIETIYWLIESADNEDFRRQTTNCEP